MSTRTGASSTEVTGVATGNLGTGTALDDTQVYSVDTLATADHADHAAPVLAAPEPAAPTPSRATAPGPAAKSVEPPHRPAPVDAPAPAPAPLAARQPGRQRRVTGGYPVGFLAAAAVALIVVAAALTFRDGGIVGGTGSGPGLAGGATFPPLPSVSAVATPAPQPAAGGQGHANGHGHGHGH